MRQTRVDNAPVDSRMDVDDPMEVDGDTMEIDSEDKAHVSVDLERSRLDPSTPGCPLLPDRQGSGFTRLDGLTILSLPLLFHGSLRRGSQVRLRTRWQRKPARRLRAPQSVRRMPPCCSQSKTRCILGGHWPPVDTHTKGVVCNMLS